MPEVVQQIVEDSEAGAYRPGSRAGGIPGQSYARLPQRLGVVLRQAGASDVRIGLDHEIGVVEIVRAAVGHFVPAVGPFVPNPETDSQIRPQLDFILDVLSYFSRAESHGDRVSHQNRLARLVLEECQHGRVRHGAR